MTQSQKIFNRNLVKLRRERCAHCFSDYRFLIQMGEDFLLGRLADMKREFESILVLGGSDGRLGNELALRYPNALIVTTDLAENMLKQHNGSTSLVVDEEFLPFADNGFDLVISPLCLHWVNDLPGCLVQIKNALKPNGVLMANMFGSGSLRELRQVLLDVESQHTDKVSMRVSPFAEVKVLGGLLQRTGFDMPVTDDEQITLHYDSVLRLFLDLRGMGQTNMVNSPVSVLGRELLHKIDQYYCQHFGDGDNGMVVSAVITTLTGLKPL